jgi:hypothetical protein
MPDWLPWLDCRGWHIYTGAERTLPRLSVLYPTVAVQHTAFLRHFSHNSRQANPNPKVEQASLQVH